MRTFSIEIMREGDYLMKYLVPVYDAEEHNSLERGSRPYTVVEILKEVFNEDFRNAIQTYMDKYPEIMGRVLCQKGATNFKLLWLGKPKVESSLSQPACSTAVDLIFRTSVEAMIPTSNGIMKMRRFNIAFRIRYLLGLWSRTCSAPIMAPLDYFPKDYITEQKTAITNQFLLPIMYSADYAKVGREMLKRYYPEALENPMAVNGLELAKRMKLKVKRVRFPGGSGIQGRIYFDRTKVVVLDVNGRIKNETVEPMTILINIDMCPTAIIENSTIVHECCHVFLDLPFFMLQMLSGKPFTSYTSRKRTKKQFSQDNGPIDWMELQAEKLIAFVLMEEKNTKKKIEEFLTECGGVRSPENIYWVMCKLADYFNVSKSMAKYRMIELGYPEAEGIYVYIENRRIPDYGCTGEWKQGITYAVSMADAGALIRESKSFRTALQSGMYTHVEGHFCLNIERYVKNDHRRMKCLTEYARHHIDECCISFKVNGRYANTTYEDAQAARKKEIKDKYQSRHEMNAEPDCKERIDQNYYFFNDSILWVKLKQNMPDGLGAAVQLILDEKGVSQEELAMRLGVSRTAWRKWCTKNISLRHIVAMCIALDVRADIGIELVRLAGQRFQNNKEHNLLLAMIYETRDLTVPRANEIMKQEKLPPLTEGQD